MVDIIPFPRSRRAAVVLARLSGETPPEGWPIHELGPEGITAAALMVDRVDLLPAAVADPGTAWARIPTPLRAVVRARNPEMAAFCGRHIEDEQ